MINESILGEGVNWARIEHDDVTYIYSTRGNKNSAAAILIEVRKGEKCLYDLGPYGSYHVPQEVRDKLRIWMKEKYSLNDA